MTYRNPVVAFWDGSGRARCLQCAVDLLGSVAQASEAWTPVDSGNGALIEYGAFGQIDGCTCDFCGAEVWRLYDPSNLSVRVP